MSGYVPKVGDRVRATLGENVLVGVIRMRSTENAWWQIDADGAFDVDPFVLSANDGWQFEQVVEVPSKKYALIGRKPYAVFTAYWLNSSGRWLNDSGDEISTETVRLALAERDYHVLFEGVDE